MDGMLLMLMLLRFVPLSFPSVFSCFPSGDCLDSFRFRLDCGWFVVVKGNAHHSMGRGPEIRLKCERS